MNGYVKSALRVLELFELFAQKQAPLRLGELVELTGHPQSSVAALLATLTQAGYLTHNRKARHYVPSAKLAQIGMWLQPPDLSDEPALMALIHGLSRATGETIVVGEQAGSYARYLHVIPPMNRPIMFHTQAGVVRPLCSSAIGVALLSLMDDSGLRDAVQRVQRDKTCADLKVRLPAVRKRVAEVRQLGFSISRNGVFVGTSMVAMPLQRPVRGRTLAIGVGAPAERLDAKLPLVIAELRQAISSWTQT